MSGNIAAFITTISSIQKKASLGCLIKLILQLINIILTLQTDAKVVQVVQAGVFTLINKTVQRKSISLTFNFSVQVFLQKKHFEKVRYLP